MSKLNPYKEEIFKLRQEGKSFPKIAQFINSKYGLDFSTRNYCHLVNKHLAQGTFSQKLDENNMPDNWSHGWLKTKEASIFIRNEEGSMPLEDVRKSLIESMNKYSPKYPKITRKKLKEENAILLSLSDLHINKYSTKEETGEGYNTEEAVKRAIEGVKGLMLKASGFEIEKIYLTLGGDILNTDGATKGTTKGTPQDTDKRWFEAFRIAKEMCINVIEYLMQIADLEIIHVMSNHDYGSGWMLTDSIYSWFRTSKNITFHTEVRHRKAFKYGDVALYISHGDKHKKSDLPNLVAHEYPELWGSTKYRYCFVQHFHHYSKTKYENGKDYIGITVQQLRSPSPADLWHADSGYVGAKQAVEAFIFNKKEGQVCQITHNF